MLSVIGSILGVILAALAALVVCFDLHPHFNWAAAGLSCPGSMWFQVFCLALFRPLGRLQRPITALRSQ